MAVKSTTSKRSSKGQYVPKLPHIELGDYGAPAPTKSTPPPPRKESK